jgi:hypothetical protein
MSDTAPLAPKRPEDSATERVQVVLPNDANPAARARRAERLRRKAERNLGGE